MRFDVSDDVATGEHLEVAASVFAPAGPPGTAVLCLPGGGFTRHYFDLAVDGHPPDAYSACLRLAARGHVVVAMDHLGTGESSRPADPDALTPEALTAAAGSVARQVRTGLADGTLAPGLPPAAGARLVGLGHSMGSMVAIAQQDTYASFDALAVTGWSNVQLMMNLPGGGQVQVDQAFAPGLPPIEDIVAAGSNAPDVPASVVEAQRRAFTEVPGPAIARMVQEAGLVRPAAERVTVPVFLGFGDVDSTADPHAEVPVFRSARDVTLYVLAGSHHLHTFATNRHLLFDRLAHWLAGLA